MCCTNHSPECDAPMPESTPHPAEQLGQHALIVDDAPVNLLIVARLLSRLGITARCAATMAAAKSACAHEHFTIALVDFRLPDGLAPELIAPLRANGVHHLLAMSASDAPDDRQTLLAAGFSEVLPKPMTLDQLRFALRGDAVSMPAPKDVTVLLDGIGDDSPAWSVAVERLQALFDGGDVAALSEAIHALHAASAGESPARTRQLHALLLCMQREPINRFRVAHLLTALAYQPSSLSST